MEQTNLPIEQLKSQLDNLESKVDTFIAQQVQTPPKRFYSVKEAAILTHTHPVTWYRRIQDGTIPSKKVGARILISSSFVDGK
jgi:excisionase family DNA binding protein